MYLEQGRSGPLWAIRIPYAQRNLRGYPRDNIRGHHGKGQEGMKSRQNLKLLDQGCHMRTFAPGRRNTSCSHHRTVASICQLSKLERCFPGSLKMGSGIPGFHIYHFVVIVRAGELGRQGSWAGTFGIGIVGMGIVRAGEIVRTHLA